MATRWPSYGTEKGGRERELARLQDQLRDNERIWAGFRRIEIGMIGARTPREVMAVLVNEIPQTFSGVDGVSLVYYDPEYEMTRLLEADTEPAFDESAFVPISLEGLNSLFAPSWKPRLVPGDEAVRKQLFPGLAWTPRSVAIAPLVLHHEFVGALNQASRDAGHFVTGQATDLLEHLAAVTAMCLDNAVIHERLKLDGLTDPLTGVANRRFFERRLTEEVVRWARQGGPLCCMLVDIDHFKQVNDRHGHQVGDRVLQQVAVLLGRDRRGADVLARYGGEEFVLLLPGTTISQGAAIAERMRAAVASEALAVPTGQPLGVTISVGLAALEQGSGPADKQVGARLLKQADAALYRAKKSGRNRVVSALEN